MKTVLLALGLKADADETEAFTAANKLRDAERALLSLSGLSTVAEALATVSAWKIAAGEVATMRAQIAEQTKAAEGASFDAAIVEAKAGGLLAPSDAHKRNVAALAFKGKPESTANLRSFLAALDPLVGVATATAVREPAAGSTVVALTPDELRIASRMGVSVEAATKNKARLLALVPSDADADTDDEDAA